MDLTPNEDQIAIQTATANWCRDKLPLSHLRERNGDIWDDLFAMGWLNMTTEAGGLDHGTEAIAFAELGRHISPISMISTAAAARWFGVETRVSLAIETENGLRIFDPAPSGVAVGLSQGKLSLWQYPETLAGTEGLDQSVAFAKLPRTPADTISDDPRAALHLQLLAADFSVGCADAAKDMATEYAKIREQFGRPIGWFQGIKHPCADMAVRCAAARSQLYYAACALHENSIDAALHVRIAKRLSSDAASENSRMNIQVHGGFGLTDEAYAHLPLKRAHLLRFIAPVTTAELLKAA